MLDMTSNTTGIQARILHVLWMGKGTGQPSKWPGLRQSSPWKPSFKNQTGIASAHRSMAIFWAVSCRRCNHINHTLPSLHSEMIFGNCGGHMMLSPLRAWACENKTCKQKHWSLWTTSRGNSWLNCAHTLQGSGVSTSAAPLCGQGFLQGSGEIFIKDFSDAKSCQNTTNTDWFGKSCPTCMSIHLFHPTFTM